MNRRPVLTELGPDAVITRQLDHAVHADIGGRLLPQSLVALVHQGDKAVQFLGGGALLDELDDLRQSDRGVRGHGDLLWIADVGTG